MATLLLFPLLYGSRMPSALCSRCTIWVGLLLGRIHGLRHATHGQERKPFLRTTLGSLLTAILVPDFINSSIKGVLCVGEPLGGRLT